MNKFGVAAWLLATLLSVWIASQAVGVVRDEVTQPRVGVPASTLVAATSPSSPTTAAPATDAPAPSVTDPTPSTIQPGGETTTSPPPPTTVPDSSTTVPGITTTTTSTTRAPTTTTSSAPSTTSTTTTTSTPPTTTSPPEVQTHQLVGGWVRIVIAGDTVVLDGAAPNVGFTMDIEKDGPSEVRVDFESADHESEFKAQWENGELVVEVNESD